MKVGQNFAQSVSLLFSWDSKSNLITCCGQKGWSCALVLMYRKLLFFFSLVNYLQVWWAGLAHWRVTRDLGVCSWEKGMERLPPDWHQCLELAVSYLGTLILWELFSPNHTASHLFFFPGGCWMSLPVPTIKKKKPPKKPEKNPFAEEQTKPFLPLALCITKNLGLEKKGFCFLEVGAHSHWYCKKQWSTLRSSDLNKWLKIRLTFWGLKYFFRIVSFLTAVRLK